MMYHPNCKLYLGMENNGAGLAKDDSGSGNHGTNNGASAVAGKFGGAASADGINDRINFPLYRLLNTNLSFCFWVYHVSQIQQFASILNITHQTKKSFQILSTNSFFRFGFNDGSNFYERAKLTENIWQFITITYDGSFKLYVNSLSDAITASITNNVLYDESNLFTRMGVDTTNYYKGILDELTIWDVALSQNNIQRLMLGMTPII